MTTKTCSGCKKVLPLARFPRRSDAPDGHRGKCRECFRPPRSKQAEATARWRAQLPKGDELGFEPIGPFLDWLDSDGQVHLANLNVRNLTLARAIRRIRSEGTRRVSVEIVDEMALMADDPGLLSRLYPCKLPEDE